MKLLEVVHPAAKTLVDIARGQDAQVGDGTTSVVLFAGQLLNEVKGLVEDGVSPQIIIKGFRNACLLAVTKLKEMSVNIDPKDPTEWPSLLEKCAATAMSSKLIHSQKDFFKKVVVDAVLSLDEDLDESLIGMKAVPGGALQDTLLVKGVAFKKTFSYAGFEQQPKYFQNPKVICLNVELELKAERDNAEIRIESVDQYQSIVDAEWQIIFDKLEKICKTGAQVVLSKLPIGDLATQYFADRGIFCAGRVPQNDLKRVIAAVGGSIQTSVEDLLNSEAKVLGTCGKFEEIQIGGERYNLFTECPRSKTCTIIMRGGAEQFLAEVERSLHDAIMIVRRALKHKSVVAGGGAVEMALSKYLRDYARSIHGKQQLIVSSFAKALEIIPRTLCDNAGFDATNILNLLRMEHAKGMERTGIDINNECPSNTFELFVWEPTVVKVNVLEAATEAACLILSVDETVKNPQSEKPPQMKGGGGAPHMRGR
jgi:T-complex protein 1 subunit eta